MTAVPAAVPASAVAEEFMGVLERRDWDGLRRVCAPGYVHHAPRVPAADLDTYIKTIQVLFAAFPDLAVTVAAVIEAGEFVTLRYVVRGTHRGPWAGLAPTGRAVSFMVLGLVRVVGGRLVEGWFEFDSGGIAEQLTGPVPAPA